MLPGEMTRWFETFKPAVGKQVLVLVAGLAWIGAGAMLIAFAGGWLAEMPAPGWIWLLASGLAAGLLVHHLGLLRIVDRNLARIRPMQGKRCLFGFQPWRSYGMIAVMIGLGIGLRHSPIPRSALAVAYLAMGAGLVLSSVRYLRVFVQWWWGGSDSPPGEGP
jgi:hypothetical protein